jgi:hypothetical protein
MGIQGYHIQSAFLTFSVIHPEQNPSVHDSTWRRNDPEDGLADHALSTPGLPNDPESFPLFHGEAHPIDSPGNAFVEEEMHPQIFYFDSRHHVVYLE